MTHHHVERRLTENVAAPRRAAGPHSMHARATAAASPWRPRRCGRDRPTPTRHVRQPWASQAAPSAGWKRLSDTSTRRWRGRTSSESSLTAAQGCELRCDRVQQRIPSPFNVMGTHAYISTMSTDVAWRRRGSPSRCWTSSCARRVGAASAGSSCRDTCGRAAVPLRRPLRAAGWRRDAHGSGRARLTAESGRPPRRVPGSPGGQGAGGCAICCVSDIAVVTSSSSIAAVAVGSNRWGSWGALSSRYSQPSARSPADRLDGISPNIVFAPGAADECPPHTGEALARWIGSVNVATG